MTVEYNTQELVIQNVHSVDATITVPAATDLVKGTVLGMVGGKYVPFDASLTTGAENPTAILLADISNSAESPADVQTMVMQLGSVYAEKLIFTDASTISTVIDEKSTVQVAMKNNGLIAIEAQQLSE